MLASIMHFVAVGIERMTPHESLYTILGFFFVAGTKVIDGKVPQEGAFSQSAFLGQN